MEGVSQVVNEAGVIAVVPRRHTVQPQFFDDAVVIVEAIDSIDSGDCPVPVILYPERCTST